MAMTNAEKQAAFQKRKAEKIRRIKEWVGKASYHAKRRNYEHTNRCLAEARTILETLK